MKSLATLWEQLAIDCGEQCDVSTARDVKTFAGRLEAEGLKFLGITLPAFAKDFERSLADGQCSALFSGWAKKGGLPVFLGGFIQHVFESGGQLMADPCKTCIRSVRQLTMLFGKMEHSTSDAAYKAAVEGFVITDREVPGFSPHGVRSLERTFARMFGHYLHDVENSLDDLIPRHGSGASAERLGANARYSFTEWPERLHKEFPYWYFAAASPLQLQDMTLKSIPGNEERPVRVVTVPKTMKAPRVIAVEPSYMQFMQQGILRLMTDALPRHPRVDETLGWTTQEPNRQLALAGSVDGTWATIDLSEASDRVSAQLVYHLLSRWPVLRRAIFACRSRRAQLPDGRIVRLRKFASMGSALCFPIECMVFAAIAYSVVGARTTRGARYGPFDVRVFGDDIIVPADQAERVCDALSLYGMRVNSSKSFWTGLFRESCGMDAYGGVEVTPVRVRRPLRANPSCVEEFLSQVALQNQLFERGYWGAAGYVESLIPEAHRVPPGTELTGVWSSYGHKTRWNRQLQRMEYREHRVVPVKRKDPITGYDALLKWFCVGSSDADSYENAGRPVSLRMKNRWGFPFGEPVG